MNDNFDEKLSALFAAARAAERDTSRAEFGFETRLAARLREDSGGSLAAWGVEAVPVFRRARAGRRVVGPGESARGGGHAGHDRGDAAE